MAVAAPGSRGRRQHAFCIPSCFSPSSSGYQDDDAPRQAFLRTPLSGQSKRVSFDEIDVVDGGEGEDAARNGTRRPADRQKRLLEKLPKVEVQKRNTTISKPFTFSTLSVHNKSDNQQHKFFYQPATAIHQQDQAQTGALTSHFGSPDQTRPVGSVQSAIKASHILGTLTGLIMVGTMMAVMLFYGRIFAIFGTCLCFYVLPFLRSLQPLPPQAAKGEGKELDVGSEEHKKKVVLMGLLQRNKTWVVAPTPVAG